MSATEGKKNSVERDFCFGKVEKESLKAYVRNRNIESIFLNLVSLAQRYEGDAS